MVQGWKKVDDTFEKVSLEGFEKRYLLLLLREKNTISPKKPRIRNVERSSRCKEYL